MKQTLILFTMIFIFVSNLYANTNKDYENLKKTIVNEYKNKTPKQWGENTEGVKTHFNTNKKIIAITMDACGSKHGMGYDEKLISFLQKQNIPATLFINARWIDKNLQTFKTLASNPLFEIANHGYMHKPASVNGRSIYGLKGTSNIEELVDEIELNAIKIQSITNKRPRYFRSGTAYYDEIAVQVANKLNHQVIGFSILGDAGATFSTKQVEKAFLKAKKGEIIIVHFNHPESQTRDGMIKAINQLKERGFSFVRLSDYPLK